jgi:hypothetical protein
MAHQFVDTSATGQTATRANVERATKDGTGPRRLDLSQVEIQRPKKIKPTTNTPSGVKIDSSPIASMRDRILKTAVATKAHVYRWRE